ncbi:MAG: response regulator, partial [Proteobacteria bacterium]|nr:response regulator [Pseudomonadota bacterium]
MAGKKILVADDSLTIQKVIRLALSGDGYEIQTVSDGKEAIEQASLFRPDVCIIDVSLPKYDAYEIRERFLQAPDLKNIPVILMSSAFEKIDEARMKSLAFAGHLVKPFDPSHLRSTLLSVSDSSPVNDPVLETINAPADGLSGPEVMSMEEFQPMVPPAPSHGGAGFDEFPPLSNDFQGGMDDIQQLARNTFEMSGLNQHDWGMIEPGKVEEPAVQEAPVMPQIQRHEPVQKTRAPEISSYDMTAPIEMPAGMGASMPSSIAAQPSFSVAEIEAIVKAEVARVLEEMHFQIQDRINHEMKQVSDEIIPNLA